MTEGFYVPVRWTYNEAVEAWENGTHPGNQVTPNPVSGTTTPHLPEHGPFQVADIEFWVRGTVDDIEIGLNIDSDSEEDIWVSIDDLEELEDENLEDIRNKAEDVL